MKKAILLSLALGLFLVLPQASQAIGQITEPIIIKDGLRGQEISSTLTLLNSEKNQNTIGIVAEGQIASWATFYNKDDKEFKNPITEITIPAGQYLDVAVLFRVPADTANGDYAGEVSVVYNPTQTSSSDESSSTVAQKISREVKITVSDQENIKLDVSVIPDKFDYNPGEPVSIRLIYDNQSNIVLSPSVQIKIKQDEKTVYNVIYPYPEGEAAVRSMSLHEIPAITISTDSLGTGKFLAELTFLKGEETIVTKNFSFSVGSSGLIAGAMTSFLKENLLAVIFGLVALALLIGIIIITSKKSAEKHSA